MMMMMRVTGIGYVTTHLHHFCLRTKTCSSANRPFPLRCRELSTIQPPPRHTRTHIYTSLFCCLAGEVGIFEMRSTGLEAVTNAAALFAPSTQDGSLQVLSDGSSRLLGTAIAVIQDGARPLPIEVQALAGPRVRILESGPPGQPGPVFEDSGVTESPSDSDGSYIPVMDESSSLSDDDVSGEDESLAVGSDIHGAGLMRSPGGDKFVAAEAGVSPRELLPMVRGVVGLQDRTRLGMLLEVLSEHTPIKVSGVASRPGRQALYSHLFCPPPPGHPQQCRRVCHRRSCCPWFEVW
jgi:hypothetical protein